MFFRCSRGHKKVAVGTRKSGTKKFARMNPTKGLREKQTGSGVRVCVREISRENKIVPVSPPSFIFTCKGRVIHVPCTSKASRKTLSLMTELISWNKSQFSHLRALPLRIGIAFLLLQHRNRPTFYKVSSTQGLRHLRVSSLPFTL